MRKCGIVIIPVRGTQLSRLEEGHMEMNNRRRVISSLAAIQVIETVVEFTAIDKSESYVSAW